MIRARVMFLFLLTLTMAGCEASPAGLEPPPVVSDDRMPPETPNPGPPATMAARDNDRACRSRTATVQCPAFVEATARVGQASGGDPYAYVLVAWDSLAGGNHLKRATGTEAEWRRAGGSWIDITAYTCRSNGTGGGFAEPSGICRMTDTIYYGAGDAASFQIDPAFNYEFRARSIVDDSLSDWTTTTLAARGGFKAPFDLTAEKADGMLRLGWDWAGNGPSPPQPLRILRTWVGRSSSRTEGASATNIRDGLQSGLDQSLADVMGTFWHRVKGFSFNGLETPEAAIQVTVEEVQRDDGQGGMVTDTTVTVVDAGHANPQPTPPSGPDPNAFRPCFGGRTPVNCFPPGPPVLDTIIVTETRTSAEASARWTNPIYHGDRERNDGGVVPASITRIEESWDAVSNTGATASGSGSSFSRSFSDEVTSWTVTFRAAAWNDNPSHHGNAYRKGPENTAIAYLYRSPETPPPGAPDLQVALSAGEVTNGRVTLTASVTNVGGGRSGHTTLRYRRSTIHPDSAGYTYTGMWFSGILGLRGGSTPESQSESFEVEVTRDVFYRACVDAVAGDTNTANDCALVEVSLPAATYPLPTGLTAAAGWGWEDPRIGYVRGVQVKWTRGGDYGCANYELRGKKSSASDFVVLSATSSCGGAEEHQADVTRMENAFFLEDGASYDFHVVAEYVRAGGNVRVQSAQVSATTCASSASTPEQSAGANPFRNCDGTVK